MITFLKDETKKGKSSQPQPTITTVEAAEFSKAEQELLRTNAITLDDNPWKSLQLGTGSQVAETLAHTYDPVSLCVLTQQNNTLLQCISAYVINIDGTGHDFERRDDHDKEKDEKEDEPELAHVRAFFEEPFPMTSFRSIRKRLRRDLESTGMAYLEVIRDDKGKIACLNHLESKLMRMVKQDAPVPVEKEFWRGNERITMKMMLRERRFAQILGTQVRYFTEYKASRDVNTKTGEWVPKGTKVTENGVEIPRSTEVIMFSAIPDVTTPYGVPRWINQIPSVLGSRRAEEYNLEFFNNGGVPPIMVIIQGGSLSKGARESLTKYLSGKAKFKQRAVIAEVFPTSGDLSGASNVKVNIERFGAERQQDSMFEKYDERSHQRIRMAFRLPPLFLGLAHDYNFATAKTAYMITEAQVFKPERDAFDEVINNTIMREIAPNYLFRSLPLTVKDVETQLKSLTMVRPLVTDEAFLDEVNEIAGLNLPLDIDALKVKKQREQESHEAAVLATRQRFGAPTEPFQDNDPPVNKGEIAKMDDAVLVELAADWAALMSGERNFEPASVKVMKTIIDSMTPAVRRLFNHAVGSRLVVTQHDPDGVEDLLGCAGECLHDDPA